jgi:hypothetical protein
LLDAERMPHLRYHMLQGVGVFSLSVFFIGNVKSCNNGRSYQKSFYQRSFGVKSRSRIQSTPRKNVPPCEIAAKRPNEPAAGDNARKGAAIYDDSKVSLLSAGCVKITRIWLGQTNSAAIAVPACYANVLVQKVKSRISIGR